MRGLERLRSAVALGRARAWQLGARPQRREKRKRRELTVIDIDATLTTAYSEKEQARGTSRGASFTIRCWPISMRPARRRRGSCGPGNAGSNTAADHRQVLDLALGQLDPRALEGEKLRPQRPTTTASKVAAAAARLSEPLPAS